MDLIAQIFSSAWGYLKRAFAALRSLHLVDIWHAIQRAWSRFHQALIWYNQHVIQPFQRMRAQLIALYNHYFGPIIKALDTVRAMIRVLAVFDKSLAAKIDRAIWDLESALYAPLYSALRRLNAVTSTLTAIVTPLGLLDRSILIQSLERDWKSIWRVLLNNGQLPGPSKTAPQISQIQQMDIDFKQFVATGDGPFADLNTQLEQVWADTLQQVG